MLTYDTQQVCSALEGAPNINAALKNFLKREVQRGAPSEKFVKKLKTQLLSSSGEGLQRFLEKHSEEYGPVLLGIARYAYSDELEEIASSILNSHADAFNATYKKSSDSIEITNSKEFERIIKTVQREIREALEQRSLPNNQFMQNVLWNWILEEPVAREVFPLLEQ